MADEVRNLIPNELGRSGLARMDGTLYEEFLPQLRGIKGVRKYREMSENSAVISAVVYAIESLLRSVEWYVEPASDEAADQEAADFLESCMNDLSHSWEEFITEILSMLVYGWSYFEVCYKRRVGPQERDPRRHSQFTDNKVGWRKFAPRSQDTLWKWQFDAAGGIRGMWQEIPPDPEFPRAERIIYLPISKCLLFRTTSRKNNPEGKSLLRGAYRAYYLGKRLEEIEAVGAERDLAGMPIAYAPVEVLATDRSAEAEATYTLLKELVTRVRRDEQEGIIFPLAYNEQGKELYKFELIASSGRRQFDIGSIIQRYNQHMAMSLLADFILLGHEKVGSFALSSDKTDLFAVSLGSILDSIEKTLNRHAVPTLFQLNGVVETERLPQIRHQDIETPNLQELGTYISNVSGAGFLQGDDLDVENFIRDAANLPTLTQEEFEEKLAEAEAKQQEMFNQQMELQRQSGKPGDEEGPPNGKKPGPGGSKLPKAAKPGARKAPATKESPRR